MSDIDNLSAAAYESQDPIDWAAHVVKCLVEAREVAVRRRANGLPPLPTWTDTSAEAVARKVLGQLMDAGWRPPSEAEVQQAAAQSRAISERFTAWWDSLTRVEQRRVVDYFTSTNQYPPDLQPPYDVLGEQLRGAS